MPERRSWLRTWGPAFGYMLLIWALSSIPKQLDFTHVPFRDKGMHFLEYSILAVLLAHALRGTWYELRVLALFALAAFATSLWGAVDEIHQAFVPNRVADVRDLTADSLGALFGAAIYLVYRARQQRSHQKFTPP